MVVTNNSLFPFETYTSKVYQRNESQTKIGPIPIILGATTCYNSTKKLETVFPSNKSKNITIILNRCPLTFQSNPFTIYPAVLPASPSKILFSSMEIDTTSHLNLQTLLPNSKNQKKNHKFLLQSQNIKPPLYPPKFQIHIHSLN